MMDNSLTENRLLKWSGKLILMMKGNNLQQNINILNDREERIHRSVSTLKLSPSDRRFIIRTISSTIDKISYTKQEKEQELFYKIMMMEKILRQRMDLHKKTGILSKTDKNWHNCVSTNLEVAINKKFTTKLNSSDIDNKWVKQYYQLIIENWDKFSLHKYDVGHTPYWKLHNVKETEIRKQYLYVILYGNLTHPQMDMWYISPIWLYIEDHTHYPDYNSLQKKRESSLWQKHTNISDYGMQQIAYLSGEKATAISNEQNTSDKLKINQCQPQRANFRNFLQQKQRLWNQLKESKCKSRKQKKKADLKRGSRFHEFCRRNNLRIHFNEYTSDRPIISFHNKNPLPIHWKIRNINQRFAIRKLLTKAHGKGKYYQLEIEITDKFQHLAAMKQTQYKDLLKELRPFKHLQTNLTAKHYYILPDENGLHVNKQKPYDSKIDTHELFIEGSLISIEYLQFLSIIMKKNCEPEFIQLSITLQDITNKFIMVKHDHHNNSLPKQINERNSNSKIELYHIKPVFLEMIRKGIKINEKQMAFSYNKHTSHLTEDILIHKDTLIDKNNFSIAHVRNDFLGLAFNVNYFQKNQVRTLIRDQLFPINNIEIKIYPPTIKKEKEGQRPQENANPKRFKKEKKDSKENIPNLNLNEKSNHPGYNQRHSRNDARTSNYYNI